MPRPAKACPVLDTCLGETASPPAPVSSGRAMNRATAAAMDARFCRWMKPAATNATALSWASPSGCV